MQESAAFADDSHSRLRSAATFIPVCSGVATILLASIASQARGFELFSAFAFVGGVVIAALGAFHLIANR